MGTSARLLKLLSLLGRPGWSTGLAARLEVTERTVRRAWWSRAAGRTTGTVRGRLGTWQLSFHRAMLVVAANTPACLRVTPGPALAVAVEDKSGAALVWIPSFPIVITLRWLGAGTKPPD